MLSLYQQQDKNMNTPSVSDAKAGHSLDASHLRYLVHKRASLNLANPFRLHMTFEIEEILCTDYQFTISFLASASDEELENMAEDILDMCLRFQEKPGKGRFIDWLYDLFRDRELYELQDRLDLVVKSLKENAVWTF